MAKIHVVGYDLSVMRLKYLCILRTLHALNFYLAVTMHIMFLHRGIMRGLLTNNW
jgi:hypothetical protein